MWQMNRSNIEPLLNPTDRLVCEMLDWAVRNQSANPGQPPVKNEPPGNNPVLQALVEAAAKAPGDLGIVASATDLKKHMAELAFSGHAVAIRDDYFRITKHYLNFLVTGAVSRLTEDEKQTAEKVFRYLYEGLLESSTFWTRYGTSVLKKKGFRDGSRNERKVCPYCDFEKVAIDEQATGDHFLAQEHFPVLSVYWANVVISCAICNSRLKLATPIHTKGGVPSNVPIFHPYYHQPADHLRFEFNTDLKPVGVVPMTKLPINVQRVENYCDVFQIAHHYSEEQKFARLWAGQLLPAVEAAYRKRSRTESPGLDLLKDVVKSVIAPLKSAILSNKGEVEKVKFLHDLYLYLENDLSYFADLLKITA